MFKAISSDLSRAMGQAMAGAPADPHYPAPPAIPRGGNVYLPQNGPAIHRGLPLVNSWLDASREALPSARHAHLSDTEAAQAKVRCPSLYAKYEQIKAVLDTRTCPCFTFEKFTQPLLLIKQYQQGGRWLSVPGAVWKMELLEFSTWIAQKRINPLNRDPLDDKSAFYQGKPARYVNVRADDAAKELTFEEFEDLIVNIREKLSASPEQSAAAVTQRRCA